METRKFIHVPKPMIRNFKEEGLSSIKHKGGMNSYPIFNTCDHYLVDMSNFREEDELGEYEWANTISVKLPNNQYLTLCIISPSGDQACVDIRFHGDNIVNTKAIGMKDGKMESIKDSNLYSVIAFKG